MGRPFWIEAPLVGSFVIGKRRASCHCLGIRPVRRHLLTRLRRNSRTCGGASAMYLKEIPDAPGPDVLEVLEMRKSQRSVVMYFVSVGYLHGGQAGLHSEPGKGSTFFIELPRQP